MECVTGVDHGNAVSAAVTPARVVRFVGYGFLVLGAVFVWLLLEAMWAAESAATPEEAHLAAHSGPAIGAFYMLAIATFVAIGVACIGFSLPHRRAKVGASLAVVGFPGSFLYAVLVPGLPNPLSDAAVGLVVAGWWLVYSAVSDAPDVETLARSLAATWLVVVVPSGTTLFTPLRYVVVFFAVLVVAQAVRRRRRGERVPTTGPALAVTSVPTVLFTFTRDANVPFLGPALLALGATTALLTAVVLGRPAIATARTFARRVRRYVRR